MRRISSGWKKSGQSTDRNPFSAITLILSPVSLILTYTNENIDKLLMERHIGAKVRRSGGRTRGPAKRTKEDNERFEAAFAKLLE